MNPVRQRGGDSIELPNPQHMPAVVPPLVTNEGGRELPHVRMKRHLMAAESENNIALVNKDPPTSAMQ